MHIPKKVLSKYSFKFLYIFLILKLLNPKIRLLSHLWLIGLPVLYICFVSDLFINGYKTKIRMTHMQTPYLRMLFGHMKNVWHAFYCCNNNYEYFRNTTRPHTTSDIGPAENGHLKECCTKKNSKVNTMWFAAGG